MTLPDGAALFPVIEATWPPAAARRLGPWTIRDGQGGGKRVSAATAEAPLTGDEIAEAEAAMTGLGQTPLFMIRPDDTRLDGLLAGLGYAVIDPVLLYAAPVAALAAAPPPPVSAFRIWPPLAIQRDLWAAGGIGPARLAVMDRVEDVKTSILARTGDQPAGTAFVACHGAIAMIHAIEVAPALRRKGTAVNILRSAAGWAQDQGTAFLALAVTRANTAANALYSSLGLAVVGHYHYRIKQG